MFAISCLSSANILFFTNTDNNSQKTHIITAWLLLSSALYGISDEAENGSYPEKEGEPSKQILTELYPFWGLLRGSESVGPVPFVTTASFGWTQTLHEEISVEEVNERQIFQNGERHHLFQFFYQGHFHAVTNSLEDIHVSYHPQNTSIFIANFRIYFQFWKKFHASQAQF